MSRLVFDIGGTNMRMALADGGELGTVEKIPTPATPEEAVETLSSFLDANGIIPDDSVGGIAGIIKDGTIIDSPNLSSWNGFTFASALAERIGVPARVYNDAFIAAYGEALHGAGSAYERVAYLGIGTGVGGALITGKSLQSEGESYEPGRLVLDEANGRTFEALVGGAALEAEFGILPRDLPRSVYRERTEHLVAGIALVVDLWSPDVVVLNGSLVEDETGFRLGDVSELLRTRTTIPLVRAAFGDRSGLEGAAGA